MFSHPLYVWHHTRCMCSILYALWGITSTFYDITPHYLWQHIHCIPDITPTTLHPLYLGHHNHSSYDLWPTLCMISHPLYVCYLMKSTYSHIHSLWTDTIVVITLLSLHSWSHTHYIWHHTHNNTTVISAISPVISDTTSTVSCFIKCSISVTQHILSGWHQTHSMYDIIFSMRDITWTLYDITNLYVWHHTQCKYDIVSNI